jgi:transposase
MSKIRFAGLDVHADTIAVAVAEAGGEVRSPGIIANKLESIRKMIGKLGPVGSLKCCYEAGPTGYVLYWQLTQLGVACEVIAPSLVPVKAGDCVKTDRRDAEKLARCYRAGELTAVWVPDAAHEALRDLVRAREGAKKDQLRHRHRLGKFLLRHGKRPIEAGQAWTRKYLNWIRIQARFEQPALDATVEHYLDKVEHAAEQILKLEKAIDEAVAQAPAEIRMVIEALQALRGVAQTTAATVVCELGSLARFQNPRQLMATAVWCRASIPAAIACNVARLPKPATLICPGFWWSRPGPIGIGPTCRDACYEDRNRWRSVKRQGRSHGKRSSGCTNGSLRWRPAANTKVRSSRPWRASYSASCGPSQSRLSLSSR